MCSTLFAAVYSRLIALRRPELDFDLSSQPLLWITWALMPINEDHKNGIIIRLSLCFLLLIQVWTFLEESDITYQYSNSTNIKLLG